MEILYIRANYMIVPAYNLKYLLWIFRRIWALKISTINKTGNSFSLVLFTLFFGHDWANTMYLLNLSINSYLKLTNCHGPNIIVRNYNVSCFIFSHFVFCIRIFCVSFVFTNCVVFYTPLLYFQSSWPLRWGSFT